MEQRGARVVRTKMLPPPVGGWNARDALSMMRPEDAVGLKNWFPRQSDVITRPGYSLHCATGVTGSSVTQLIPFEYGSYSALIACAGGSIVDASTSTPSSLATGLGNSDWSYDYIGGYVLMANGADVVKSYNGVAIANPAFTGVTLTTLNHVSVFKSRAYFVEANSQSMWYGGIGAVSGALTEFDFSTVASVRGNLIITTHLKGDGGDGGQDDLFMAIFAGGDVLAYTGSDPGDATNWSLVGHYHIGRPLSRLGHARLDDDAYVVTSRGYERLGELTKFGNTLPERLLISSKIQQAVLGDIAAVGANADWRVSLHPAGQMLIVTSPLQGTARRYHVRNINTNAWCEFGDFLAYSWTTFAGDCYFGGAGGKVYAFDNGSITDNGAAIRCDAEQAWTSLGAPGLTKHVQLIKPFVFSGADPALSVNVGSDYAPVTLAAFTSGDASQQSVWNTGVWNVATWGYGQQTFANWYSRNAIGEAIGFRVAVDAEADRVMWNQTVMLYTIGGPI